MVELGPPGPLDRHAGVIFPKSQAVQPIQGGPLGLFPPGDPDVEDRDRGLFRFLDEVKESGAHLLDLGKVVASLGEAPFRVAEVILNVHHKEG
jgi:hypothetical protein